MRSQSRVIKEQQEGHVARMERTQGRIMGESFREITGARSGRTL